MAPGWGPMGPFGYPPTGPYPGQPMTPYPGVGDGLEQRLERIESMLQEILDNQRRMLP